MPKKLSRGNGQLPVFEKCAYFFVWLSCIVYAMRRVYKDGDAFLQEGALSEDFTNGWPILDRMKDISDYEWVRWRQHITDALPWCLIQLVLCQFVRWSCVKAIPLSHLAVTALFIAANGHHGSLAIYVPLFLIFFLVMLTKMKSLVWISGILVLLIMNTAVRYVDADEYETGDFMIIFISTGWFLIRCIEFTLVEMDSKNYRVQSFLNMMAYVFYFPCFHLGPFIPYSEFEKYIYAPFRPWKFPRVMHIFRSILKYTFWVFTFEFASHYFYCQAMHYSIDHVLSKNGYWTLNGVGYCMSIFFFIKYYVVYGSMGTMAIAEGYDAPPPPRCIHWVFLYSEMWRHFDRGFYLFIFRRIYLPICGKARISLRRKLFASSICFCFVYIWHGTTFTIFFWTLFNFFGVTLEALFKMINEEGAFKKWKVKHLSYLGERRLDAILTSPLWVLAVFSNFIFFGGYDYGFVYFKQLFFGTWRVPFVLTILAYCMCHVSTEVSYWMLCVRKDLGSKVRPLKESSFRTVFD